MKRHSTCYRMTKAIVEKKEFGKINAVELRFAHARYPAIWGIEEPARAFLIGQAIHMFNLIRFFCREVDEIYARLKEVDRIDFSGIFCYAINATFKNGIIDVLNLNASQCPDWQVSEYLAPVGYECWLEVKDMVELSYHANKKPMSEFNPHGRAQIFSWKPEFSELLTSKAEGFIGYIKVSCKTLPGQ